MRRVEMFAGYKSGRLTTVAPALDKKGNLWNCICECGNNAQVAAKNLRYGTTQSCGCLRREHTVEVAKRNAYNMRIRLPHGKKLVALFAGMMNRCHKCKTHKAWDSYGGRGIKVCDEWRKDRHKFYEWATKNGYEPGLEIDRIDVNGDYSPENCRFVSTSVNANNRRNNRRIEWSGEIHTVTEWARKLGVRPNNLFDRLYAGWSIERTMTEKLKGSK